MEVRPASEFSVEPRVRPDGRTARLYRGNVAYLYAFDVAYDMSREPIRELLGQAVTQFQPDTGKRNPRELFFYRPQMVRLPSINLTTESRLAQHIERAIKVFSIGAVSVSFRVPFEVRSLTELVHLHDAHVGNVSLHESARQIAQRVVDELRPRLVRPVQSLRDEEAYTVFCLESPVHAVDGTRIGSERWLDVHRAEVAALLTQETDSGRLSQQEIDDTTRRYVSYYENDLVVADWDAAVVVEEPRNFEEILHIMELANVQLAELEAYDRLLDEALDNAYRDLRPGPHSRGRRRWSVMADLRELRIDAARISDELSNITKFFGDWHLARVYQNLSARFHLGDWHATIDEKLQALDNLYQLLQQARVNWWMMMLEATIVLLFIIDVVILIVGWDK